MYIGFGLGGSTLDAKGGIVGGTIDLNKINTYSHIWEEQGLEPHHKLGLTLAALELRLDYMGTSVCIFFFFVYLRFFNGDLIFN